MYSYKIRYIYREREKRVCVYIYIYIYVYTQVYTSSEPSVAAGPADLGGGARQARAPNFREPIYIYIYTHMCVCM